VRAGDASPRQIREWRNDLAAFRDTYTAYLNQTLNMNKPVPAALRREVVRLAQPAQEALHSIGAVFAWDPPPITQTPRIYGVVNTVFLHETPFGGFSEGMFGNWPTSYEGILNAVEIGISHLDKLAIDVRRRRRNPLYWGDRVLRALLGFPAYLLGLIFRVPARQIDESALGLALRIAAFVVEVAVLVLGLNELLHWF
jgi:hypothetical protein